MSTEGRRSEDWLCEEQTGGTRLCLRVRKWLVRRRTPYHELVLAETEDHGMVLVLDGKFMLSERDEAYYHEMLVHPAMFLHPSPRSVLIVGGGDGGALREVLRHSVKEATVVEIDGEVIEISREFLAPIHQGAFDDSRAQVVVAPGEEFLPKKQRSFDVIIVDSTDPIGSGKALFTEAFFSACQNALRPGGIVAFQAGTPFYWPDELSGMVEGLSRLFPCVRAYLGFVPIYPSGFWAYVIAGDQDLGKEANVAERFSICSINTRYYTPEVHKAAFALPKFLEELVARAKAKVEIVR